MTKTQISDLLASASAYPPPTRDDTPYQYSGKPCLLYTWENEHSANHFRVVLQFSKGLHLLVTSTGHGYSWGYHEFSQVELLKELKWLYGY